ncbi:MAG: helix-turn-helix domain-containing protein [Ruminococcus sp.]|nr:helix-turn-helix domain-containing protein [Ruminococcus sp.]
MIKHLSGDYETVEYDRTRFVMLYDNDDFEEYPTHWHNAVEIIMPLQGTYTACTGGHTYVLNERDIIILPSGELHLLPQAEGRRLIFQCDNEVLEDNLALNAVLPSISDVLVITPETDKKLHLFVQKCMLDISTEYFSDNPLADTRIYVLLINMMLAVREHQLKQQTSAIADSDENFHKFNEKFNKVIKFIDKNYMHDISLDTLADIAGYSKYHFSRIFKQFSSMSHVTYINRRRIKAAEALLLDPKLSVTDVAVNSGFSSLTTFNRVFKEIKHCTPSEFKKLYENSADNFGNVQAD